jgi:hypothetical protein
MGGAGSRIVDRIAYRASKLPNWEEQIGPLTQFVAIDTNKLDQNRLTQIPTGNRILIGGFDKVGVIEGYREAKNRQATSWIDESYHPREGIKPGAGQIRIESRLGFFYNSARIRQRLEQIVDDITRPNITWRQSDPPYFYVYLVSTLAGGTGSGSFLSMAYLVRDVIRNRGIWQPRVIAKLLLSTLMTDKVSTDLHLDIHANTYSALKELEHLTKLNYPRVKEEGRKYEEFAYWYNESVGPAGEPSRVESAPFFMSFIHDRAARFAIPDFEAAVADASYLELFTPNIDNFASSLDNYEKHLVDLTKYPGDLRNVGLGYTKNFGAMGAAVMLIPADDLLQYCALRFAAEALRSQITFGVDTHNPRDERSIALAKLVIDYDAPAFRNMVEEEQQRIINERYVDSVLEMKRQEERDEQPNGFWSKLVESVDFGPVIGADEKTGEPRRGESLVQVALRKLKEQREKAVNSITIRQRGFTFHKESVGMFQDYVDKLKEDVIASRRRIDEQLPGLRRSAEEGEVISALKLDPLTERYLVLRLTKKLNEEAISGAEKQVKTFEANDIRKATVTDRFEELRQQLMHEAAPRGLGQRMKGMFHSDADEAFQSAKDEAETYYRGIANGTEKLLDAEILLSQLQNLVGYLGRRANQYARLSRYMNRVVHDLFEKAEELRRGQGGMIPFALEVEVLQRMEEPKERLWDKVFDELFVLGGRYSTTFDRRILAETIARELGPIQVDGRVRAKTDDETVADLKRALLELGRTRTGARIMGTAADQDYGLDLYSALTMEAALVLREEGVKRGTLREGEPVPQAAVDRYLETKLRSLHDLCGVMARVNTAAWRAQNDGVVLENTRHVVHGLNAADGRTLAPAAFLDRVQAVLSQGVDKLNTAAWHDSKMIVVYDAQAPIPLYYFSPICSDIENAYERVAQNLNRGYKLHTDARWEESLPNLNPAKTKIVMNWVIRTLLAGWALGKVSCDAKKNWWYSKTGQESPTLLGKGLSKALYKLGERGALEDLKRGFDRDLEQARSGLSEEEIAKKYGDLSVVISKELERIMEKQITDGRATLTPEDVLDIPILQTLRQMAEEESQKV